MLRPHPSLFSISAVLLCLAFFVYGCSDDPTEPGSGATDDERSFALMLDTDESPDDFALVFTNTSNHGASFRLTLGERGPYATNDDLATAVMSYPSEFPGEPIHRKVWRFVRDHHDRSYPLTGLRWQHNPALFLNSLGFGFCDDAAAVSYFLWSRLGYRARVWSLTGHVVSEVNVDGSWEMYDASLDVYYLDDHGHVVGVEDLEGHPELVTVPIDPIQSPAAPCYSRTVAEIYTTVDDNFPGTWYMTEVPAYDLAFVLPPKATLKFPLPLLEQPTVIEDGTPPPQAANAELVVPTGWSGSLSIGLVVQGIAGAYGDSVTIAGTRLGVGSPELRAYIDRRASNMGDDIDTIEFDGPMAPVRVRYFVNPKIFRLGLKNSVRLDGHGLAGIDADLVRVR